MSEPRKLQTGQDGTTTDNNCYIAGDFNVCPATADFDFNGAIKRLNANLKCPLNAVQQSDFRDASQKGLCECEAEVMDVTADTSTTGAAVPLSCECFICPDQANLFGVAYTCSTPINGPCYTFNCEGTCNGDLSFIDSTTRAPTAAPGPATNGNGSGAFDSSPGFATMALLVLTFARMLR